MGLTQFLVEIYVGNSIAQREQLILPVLMAIQQAVSIVIDLSKQKQPMKAVFINEDNEKIEYKNTEYIKFEGGNNE